jgi:hypothetical protein
MLPLFQSWCILGNPMRRDHQQRCKEVRVGRDSGAPARVSWDIIQSSGSRVRDRRAESWGSCRQSVLCPIWTSLPLVAFK